MKNTLLSFAVGFLVARQLCIYYTKKVSVKRQIHLHNVLTDALEKQGLSPKEIHKYTRRI